VKDITDLTLGGVERMLRSRLVSVYPDSEAAAIADMVLTHLTGNNRLARITRSTDRLPDRDAQKLLSVWLPELLAGRPVQYLLGEVLFYGLQLQVREGVLIPRPETEELVDWCVSRAMRSGRIPSAILDVGTGSGCIALALKKAFSNAAVYALDVSEAALEIARANATANRLEVSFRQVDILLPQTLSPLAGFDLIVSNPPYILPGEAISMPRNVRDYEPHQALFVTDEQDPLQFYKAIARFAAENLRPTGDLFFEVHEAYGADVVRYLQASGWHTELRKDFQGKDRMLRACRPHEA